MQHLPLRRRHQGDGRGGPFLCAEPARPACRARLRSLLHHALPASGSRCGNAAPGIARRADRRRAAVVRRQAGLRLLLAQMRRHHGRRRCRVGRSARAVPAESRGPVLPAAGRGRVALERARRRRSRRRFADRNCARRRRWTASTSRSAPARGARCVLALVGNAEQVRVSASSFRFAIGRALGFNTVRSDRWSVVRDGRRN